MHKHEPFVFVPFSFLFVVLCLGKTVSYGTPIPETDFSANAVQSGFDTSTLFDRGFGVGIGMSASFASSEYRLLSAVIFKLLLCLCAVQTVIP